MRIAKQVKQEQEAREQMEWVRDASKRIVVIEAVKFHKQWVKLALLIILINSSPAIRNLDPAHLFFN
jgi:hypothetical protein